MSAERAVGGYRALFYLAVVVALGTTGLAWWSHRKFLQALEVDTLATARQRDTQYAFTVEAYGYKYRGETGNLIDEEVLLFGAFEKSNLFFMRDYLKNTGIERPVAIDVGANTGHHALFLSRHAAKVHAFEPFPPVIAKFRDNLALNPDIRNVELHEVGLGDKDAELPFVAPPGDNHGRGTFRTEASQVEERQTHEGKLRIVVGDDWLKDREPGAIALIKIDVEGFEAGVLAGLRETMARHRPLVVVEVTHPPVGTIDTIDKLVALLPEGYELLALERTVEGALNGRYALRTVTAKSFNAGHQLEIVAYPRERKEAVPGRP